MDLLLLLYYLGGNQNNKHKFYKKRHTLQSLQKNPPRLLHQ